MKQFNHLLLVIAMSLTCGLISTKVAAQACTLENVQFITEHSPPFSYLDNGEVFGSAVDAVLALTRAAGCPISRGDISLQPWARGYRSVLNSRGKAIFSITRTRARTPLLQWVGPIGQGTYGLLAKKGRQFDLSTPLSRAQYQYGAIRDDIGEKYLHQFGISDDNILRAVLGSSMAKVLQADRIDLWVYSQTSANDSLKAIGADPNDYELVKMIAQHDYYLAFSLDVDKQTIATLQRVQSQLWTAAQKAKATSNSP